MVLVDDNFCRIIDAVELGRAIYDGIQKFVAFIMSVHIAEVIQIFFCIVSGIPIMRTPLQILFLIIVTDLPPSIALGMEPGEKSNMKKAPRPREEPVVLGWMWVSIVLNGMILSAVIIVVYLVSLWHYCDGAVLLEDILLIEDNREEKLMAARTVAFVSLVLSENVRAYASRSFNQFFYKNMFGNACMQYAVVTAQLCLVIAVFTPFFSDKILGLSGTAIWSWGWIVAFAGPVATLFLCELGKVATSWQMKRYNIRQSRQQKVVIG
jgi:magnesium-transporting ATPase (P-type)